MRVLFLVPYPTGKAGSQRFRFEHYYDSLRDAGYRVDVSPFIDEKTWNVLYRKGHHLRKIAGIVTGYLRRIADVLFRAGRYDFVFVHRELAPFGPPLLSWWLARVQRARILYDFDDAVWIPNYSENNSWTNHLKRFANTRNLCSWAYKVSCGNAFLRDYALQFNPRSVLNPTVIDTDAYVSPSRRDGPFVIGWTGSHSTMVYLRDILEVLKELEQEHTFRFHVISDVPPEGDLRSLVYVPWNKATEVRDLAAFDIGVMPLHDDAWARGKCGFKALQYLALGIPALVSPVGVNTEIVTHGVNGFHCATPGDWKKYIVQAMNDPGLLERLRPACRDVVASRFSVASNRVNFMSLFN